MGDVIKEIGIKRMDCPTCVVTLENSVMKIRGVKKAQGNYFKKSLKITYDEATSLAAIENAIEDAGYQVAYKRYPGPLAKLRGLFDRSKNKSIKTLTDADFPAKVLQSTKTVVVLFGSEACPSCQVIKPQLEGLAEKHAGRVDFYELEITRSEVWKDYDILGIPTIIIFLNGKPTNRFIAILSIDELEKALNE